MRTRMRRLSSQIFVAELVILTMTMLVGFLLSIRHERAQLDVQYEARAASIAESTAQLPEIRRCMQHEVAGCAATIQQLSTSIAAATEASYVVVIDMNRVRHSHPNPALIGKQVAEPIVVTDGRVHVGSDDGITGRSANGKAPLRGLDGSLVGEVSVGLREKSVSKALTQELPAYATWFGVALGLGAIASWFLARHLKRRTFGLELEEIALLLQEREATLHGVREGVIAFDVTGHVSMINDQAQTLLGLHADAVGRTLSELLPAGRLRDVLDGVRPTLDEVVITDDYSLVVNRMPVILAGRPHGSVVTLRDRTELAAVLSELDGERGLTDSLRAQQHEFANRMHAVAGLLELGHPQEALSYLTEIRGIAAELDNTLRSQVAAPAIVGLLLGKAAEASERGIRLEISPATWLSESPGKVQVLTTVVGNLVDNAMEALVGQPPPRHVLVEIVEDDDQIAVRVSDNGPGVPADLVPHIFSDGYTTKAGPHDRPGGLGLALVHRLVARLGGAVGVDSNAGGTGAVFTVTLPKDEQERLVAVLPREVSR
ncbi:sensor histidine kinase [Acidothermaceae bacterium B102]|nr:sensor histidine kinase [Acidothermaceae bacterium B102]